MWQANPSTAVLAGAAVIGAAAVHFMGTNDAMAEMVHDAVLAEDIEWQDGPDSLEPGAEVAVLAGDPYAEGLYTLRVKLPPNFTVAPHFHPRAENVTVIEGTLHLGMGETLDRDSGDALTAGGFISIPANHAHYAWTEDEETIFQIHAEGPYEIHYIHGEDDPRS
jgi:quercetin dioxygenase-like cupin family protein